MGKLNVKFMVAIGDGSLCPGVFFLGWKEVKAGSILRWEPESGRPSYMAKSPLHGGLGAHGHTINSSWNSIHRVPSTVLALCLEELQASPPPALKSPARLQIYLVR